MRSLFTSPLACLTCTLLLAGCVEDNQNLGGPGGGGSGGTGASTSTNTSTQGGGGQGGGAQGGNDQGGNGGNGGNGGQGGGFTGDGTHYARFGFRNGQETVGDFCAAYSKDGSGNPIWSPTGILAASGLTPTPFDGLEKLTAYLPLEAEPLAFGFAYPGASCADGALGAFGSGAVLPTNVDHFTVLAVPYSFEPIQVWVVGDPITTINLPDPPPGFRVVNAISSSDPIEVSTTVSDNIPAPHGTFDFANSPTDYILPAQDHLFTLTATESPGTPGEVTVTFDFTSINLLSVKPRRTIYISGVFPDTALALACTDTLDTQSGDPTSSSCFLFEADL